jgi:hypothetical protein
VGNPYTPPEHVEDFAARTPGAIRLARRFPVTLSLLFIAAIVSVLASIKEYRTQVRMEQEGAVLTHWSPLDGLSMPGVFCMYAAIVLTNSFPIACVAGALGMAATYGLPGFVLDVLRLLYFRRQSELAGKHGKPTNR